VRERERQTRERGGQTEVLMLTQPPILPLRDEVMAAADQRQTCARPAPETRYRPYPPYAVTIMLLPCPDDSIRCPAIQYQIPNRVACAHTVSVLLFLLCAAAALLLPFALALALILAARRPQPASHSIPFSKAVAWSVAVLHYSTLRCGAVLESLHNCQQLHAPALLPFPSFAELYPRRIVSIFARLTPSLPFRSPGCPPAPLLPCPPCDSQTRSLALVPAGQ
jgi:hypothetical protein